MRQHAHLVGCEIRARLGHPILVGDAPIDECYPAFLSSGTGRGHRGGVFSGWVDQSGGERKFWHTRRPVWWGMPTRNLQDAATVVLPGLVYERMAELGSDFTFGNAVRLHGGMNPRFFGGTAIEAEAVEILAGEAR